MGKLLAYILMVVGVVLIALPLVPGLKDLIAKTHIQSFWIIIIGLIVIALGFVFMKPGKGGKVSQSSEEVPIYQGKKIVGYRKEK